MAKQAGIVGVLLASGLGTRFDRSGKRNKLLATLPDGRPVIRAAAQALCAALGEVVVVVRRNSVALDAALDDLPLRTVVNSRAALGMGTSIACAVAATPDARGWLIALGDMPFVGPATIASLADQLALSPEVITAPTFSGQRGHPVGFGLAHRAILLGLDADQGPRDLLRRHPLVLVAVPDSGILRDIDRPEDLPPH